MAVTVNNTMDFGSKLVDALGIDPALYKQMCDHSIKITQGVNKVKFMSSDASLFLGEMKAADGAIALALKKAIGATSLAHLKASFEHAAKQSIESVKTGKGSDAALEDVELNHTYNAPKTAPVITTSHSPDDATVWVSPTDVDVIPENQMMTMTPVKLMQATKLYQPVHGTSTGSRYFVVAISQFLKIAARWKANELSIRVEGKVADQKQLLQDNQFNIGSDGTYASLHVKCPDMIIARRVIGAVLTGLDMQLVTPLPQFDKLVGKGA